LDLLSDYIIFGKSNIFSMADIEIPPFYIIMFFEIISTDF